MTDFSIDKIDFDSLVPEAVTDEPVNAPLQSTMVEAVKVNPDSQVEFKKLSRESGMPIAAVETDPVSVKSSLDLKKINFDEMSKRNPGTAKYLTDYENATIAHDDSDALTKLEDTLKIIPAAITQATLGISESIWRTPELIDRYVGAAAQSIEDITGIPRNLDPIRGIQDIVGFISEGRIPGDIDLGLSGTTELAGMVSDATRKLTEQPEIFPEAFSRLAIKGQEADAALGDALKGDFTKITGVLTDPEAWAGFLGQAAPSLMLAYASGGSIPFISWLEAMGTASSASEFEESTGQKMTDAQFVQATTQAGLINAWFEKAGLDKILGSKGGGIAEIMKSTLTEGSTEALQEFNSNFAQFIGFNRDQPLTEGLLASAMGGAGAGGVTSTVMVTTSKVLNSVERKNQRSQIQQNTEQNAIDSINTESTKSKLKERDKESFREFMQGVNEDADVFIDGAQTSLYLQTKSAEEIAADPGLQLLQKKADEAAAIGGDLTIPVADFATDTTGTEAYDVLREHMTLSPETTTPFRQEQEQQEAKNYVETLINEAQESASTYVESQDIFESVRDQLIDTGRMTPQQASVMADIVPAWATVQSIDRGIPVEQVYRESGLHVEGPMTGEAARLSPEALEQRSTQLDEFSKQLQEDLGLTTLFLSQRDDGDLNIGMIEVPKDSRKQGVGTEAMERIIQHADSVGSRITLTPGLKDDIHGTTSRSRLVKFYKRFGFVENKGRNKDFTISESMYRPAKEGVTFEQKNLLDKVEQSDIFNIGEAERRIEDDNYIHDRLPQGARTVAKGSTLEAAQEISKRSLRSVPENESAGFPVAAGIKGRKQEAGAIREAEAGFLKRWAEQENLIIPDFEQNLNKAIEENEGVELGGRDNYVFLDESTGKWMKANRFTYAPTFTDLFDSIALHNEQFASSAYTFEGLAEVKGELLPIFSQADIFEDEGVTDKQKLEMAEEYLESLGYTKTDPAEPTQTAQFTKGDIIVEDIHPGNVIIKDGIAYIFDPIIRLNPTTKAQRVVGRDIGGERQDIGEEDIDLAALGAVFEQAAFHGTPHKFDKFTLDHIGKGEGAQAFGWGLYFAENKDVAQFYKESTARSQPVTNKIEEIFTKEYPDGVADVNGIFYKSAQELANSYEFGNFGKSFISEELSSELDQLNKGTLIKVELAPEADEWLDWDKPLSEQSEKVQKTLKQIDETFDPQSIEYEPDADGAGIYEWLVMKKGGQEQASLFLKDIGIPGIRYFDATSRTEQKGTSNFVVFDEELIEIQQFLQKPQNGGAKGYYDPANSLIRLTESSDLSTFLHEFAHFMYDMELKNPDSQMTEKIHNWFKRNADDVAKEANGYVGKEGEPLEQAPITDIFEEQIEVNGQWFHAERVFGKPAEQFSIGDTVGIDAEIKQFDTGEITETASSDLFQESGANITDEQKINRFVEIMDEQGGWGDFPPITGVIQTVTKEDVENYSEAEKGTLEGELAYSRPLTENDIGTEFVQIENGHHRAYAAAKLGLEIPVIDPSKGPQFAQADTPPTAPPTTGNITAENVVAYLDNKTSGDIAKDKAIERAVHEQFARGFETYLMEGKAPSAELRNVFRTFARWLTQIYRAIQGDLKVNLDQEMRDVFARMVATEEQINAAEARAQFEPLFTDAAMAGMTEEEFQKYQERQAKSKDKASETLRDKLIKQLTRQTEKWWREEKSDIVDEEMERLKTEKVYVARETLLTGEFKLDRPTVKEMVGEERTDKLGRTTTRIPEALRNMTAQGGEGVHPDEAAGFLGYASGDELVQAIIAAPTIKKVAEQNAEAQMVERHGDIMNDGTIEKEADEAVQNEERGKLILDELKTLSKDTGRAVIERQMLKTMAEENIGKLSFRNIHPGKYRTAEIRAAQESAAAFATGNKEEAATAKARQALNFYLGKAATEAKNGTIKIVDRMARYRKKGVREAIMRAGNGYWEQLTKILNRFEFRKAATLTEVDKLNENINEWMKARIEDDGDALILSPAVLDEGYITHWKNVPYDELQGINDSIKNLEHVARYSNKITRQQEEMTFQKLVDKWVTSMNEKVTTRFKSQRTDVTEGKKWGRWAMAQMTKIPFLASWLDGQERAGISHDILVQPFTDAYNEELKLWGETGTPVMEAIMNRSKEDLARHNTKRFIPAIKDADNDGNLFGHQVLAVALNTGNESNLKKLLLGEGWANPEVEAEISFDNPKLQAVLKHMTQSDWELVQLIWDQMDTLYPKLAEVHRKTTGLVPPKVESTPVETEFGTFKGGYYPVKYDPNRSFRASQNEDRLNAETESMFGGVGIQASVNASSTNERTGYYAPMRLSLDIVPDHFQETIHYITHHDAVRETNKLIRNESVATTIKEKLGPEEYAQLKPWLNDIAKDGREAPVKMFWGSILQRLRFGTTLGVMGFKASTGIIQILGLSNTIAEVGSGPVYQATRSILGSTTAMKDAWDFAVDNSKVMEHRVNTMDREIKNAMQKIEGKRGIFAAVQEASMKHIALMQTYMVDLPSWHAAYIKGMTDWGDEKRAYAYADWVIENIQGSGITKDMAQIMRNQSQESRMFTMFMTFFSSLWNQERDLVKGTRVGTYSRSTVAAKMMFMFAIPVFLEMLLRGEFGDDDDDESKLQKYLTNTALYPVQSIPFVRDIASATVGEFGYNISPIAQLIESGTKAIPELVTKAFTDEEVTKGQVKGATKFIGAAAGVPGINQAWSTGEHLYDVMVEGEELTLNQLLYGPRR